MSPSPPRLPPAPGFSRGTASPLIVPLTIPIGSVACPMAKCLPQGWARQGQRGRWGSWPHTWGAGRGCLAPAVSRSHQGPQSAWTPWGTETSQGTCGPPKTHSPPGCRDSPSPRSHRTPGRLGTPRCVEAQGAEGPDAMQTPKGTWDPWAHGVPKWSGSPRAVPGVRQPQPPHRLPALLGCRCHVGAHPPQEEELREPALKWGRERVLSSLSPRASRQAAAGTLGRAGKEGSRDTGGPSGHVASPARARHDPGAAGRPIPNSSAFPQPQR